MGAASEASYKRDVPLKDAIQQELDQLVAQLAAHAPDEKFGHRGLTQATSSAGRSICPARGVQGS
jgi:hypothetical protein